MLLTWLFIETFDGYISATQMFLSNIIAGGKWGIQLALGWFLLGEKKWRYFRELGAICAAGSCALLPFILLNGDWTFFIASLTASVILMAILVVLRLKTLAIHKRWTAIWFILLAIAVTLQLTVVLEYASELSD